MKKARRIIAWLLLGVSLAAAPGVIARLPVLRRDVLIKRYEGFSGVLRFWVSEGFEPGRGTLHGWLMGRIRQFERRRPGVYIQITHVDAERLRAFAAGGVNPPDIILFAPGMLDAPDNLMPLSAPDALKPSLGDMGAWQGAVYALPVAMGLYGWALGRTWLPDGLPERFEGLEAPAQPTRKKSAVHWLDAPADGDYMSWSGALLTLLVGEEVSGAAEAPKAGEGISLGLPEPTASAQATEPPARTLLSMGIPDALPDNFRSVSSVYSAFTGGRAAAIPVTQREIYRLATLSESGRAPDYRIQAPAAMWTDQVALAAVVWVERADADARRALSAAFIELLLTEDAQRALSSVGAFQVIDAAPLYGATSEMAALERGAEHSPAVPPAFGAAWRAEAQALMDAVASGRMDAVAALERLFALGRPVIDADDEDAVE